MDESAGQPEVQPQPEPQPAAEMQPEVVEQQTPGLAVTSLVLGLCSWLLCVAGPLASIPAVICGHAAKKKINASPDTLKGGGLAVGGLVAGYLNIVGSIVGIIVIIMMSCLGTKVAGGLQSGFCTMNLGMITAAKEQCAIENGMGENDVPTAADLDPYLDGGFSGLQCPDGGTYEIKSISEMPSCSVHGDTLGGLFDDESIRMEEGY